MEYLPFYGLFAFWFGALVASIPDAPETYEKEICEIKEIIFGRPVATKPDLRKAA